jgi:uncharacterized metal-binding protein YceD (DUF177 family)
MQGPVFKTAACARKAAFMPNIPDLPQKLIRMSDLKHRQPTAITVEPDAAGRQAVAQDLGIVSVKKLRLTGTLTPLGKRDWQLDATLGATVVQDCIITLAPVTTRIEEPVIRRYLADMAAPGPGEVEMPDDDTTEALPIDLDLAAVMIEALALALPPYPRAPGAEIGELTVTEPGAIPLSSDTVKPFASLAALRDSLQTKAKPDETP